MTIKVHHRKNGTFAAEIPTGDGNIIVFSHLHDHDPGHSDQYEVLRGVLLEVYGLILPPLSEVGLAEPGDAEVVAEDSVDVISA